MNGLNWKGKLMTTRVERILTKLAQRHAPYVLQQAPQGDNRLRYIADELALNGVMLLAGTIKSPDVQGTVNQWATGYTNLYMLLTKELFPHFTEYRVLYADKQHPPLLVFEASLAAVTEVLAGYVTPYIAAKQQQRMVSEAEMLGIMTYILEALAADDLPRARVDYLCMNGQRFMRDLLQLPVDYVSLTSFARPLFQKMQQHNNLPPPPAELPEPPFSEKPTDTKELFTRSITEQLLDDRPPAPPEMNGNGHRGNGSHHNGHIDPEENIRNDNFRRSSRRGNNNRRRTWAPLRPLPDDEDDN